MTTLRRPIVAAVLVLIAGLWLAPATADAQGGGRKKTDGCLLSYDEATNIMVIKDKRSRKPVEFRVKQATSVLDRAGTVATKDGRKAQLVDLETNRPVIAYWLADPENPGGKFANKVDQPDFIDDETGQPDPDLLENAGCKLE